MNPRHAAAFALVGWTLWFPEVGVNRPKDGDCNIGFGAVAGRGGDFRTETQCEKAGEDFVSDFYAMAKKNGEKVCVPPAKPQCIATDDPRLKEK